MMNDEQEPKSNPMLRNMAIWSAIIVALLLVASIFSGSSDPAKGISYSSFRDKVEAGEVKSVAIAPERISGRFQNDETFATVPVPNDTSLLPLLDEKGVDVQGKAEEQPLLSRSSFSCFSSWVSSFSSISMWYFLASQRSASG